MSKNFYNYEYSSPNTVKVLIIIDSLAKCNNSFILSYMRLK